MDSLRGQGGIQMLLSVEQEAGRIVSAARSAKLARLKQAKDEAEKEMEQYRSRLEEDYQKQVTGTDQEVAVKKLEEETDVRIKDLNESGSKVSKDIVKMLIKYVTTTAA